MSRSGGGPRLRELAEILGVTPTAVSIALNDRPGVSEELRTRVKALAKERGYRPHHAARALRVERSDMLGLINRNLNNPGYLQLIDGFNNVAEERGYQVLVGTSEFDRTREAALLSAIAARQLDGLAIAPVDGPAVIESWQDQSDRPLLLLNSGPDDSKLAQFSIRADGSGALDDALDHLRGLGHRRIQLLISKALSSIPERADRFRRSMKAAGLSASVMTARTAVQTVRQLIGKLSAGERPTACIADSDLLAHYLYEAAHAVGLRIPEDLSVVGFDDLPTSHLLGPPLTTFTVDRHEIGRSAASMLIDSLKGQTVAQTHHVVSPTLVIRGSTAVSSP